jgi:methylmalonyl-CoA mutase
MLAALKEGYPQEEIAKVLAARFKAAETRKDRIVGNNMYPNMTETLLDPRPEDIGEIKKLRQEEVESYLADLDEQFKEEKLAELSSAKEGLVKAAVEAARAGATIEELAEALHGEVKGEEQVTAIAPHRWSERFEALRKTTEDYKAEHGENVKIFLANMGPIPQHKARADFSTGFLQVGAFEVLGNNGFKTVEEAAEAAKASGADAVVICSTDATYPEIVPALAPKLHEVLPQATVFLAGAAPQDMLETYNQAGIDEYIHVRANCYQILQLLQKKKAQPLAQQKSLYS